MIALLLAVALPLTVTDSGTLQATGRVAGRPALLTLDTGAGSCRLPPSLLAGAPAAGEIASPGRPGEPARFPLARVSEISLGPARLANVPVARWELLDEMHQAGIASALLFEVTPVTFDLAGKRLVFETPEGLAARTAAGAAAPLEVRREGESSLLLYLTVSVDGAPVRALLDTGWPGALELAEGGGTHEVALGGLSRRVRASVRKGARAARLGLAYFEGCALTLDVPGKRIVLSR